MSQNYQEGQKNPRIRGWIVRILDKAYPAGLEADQLFKQLEGLGYDVTRSDVKRGVAYLESEGYVTTMDVKSLGLERKTVTNTSKAVDLLEGLIEEPAGVDV